MLQDLGLQHLSDEQVLELAKPYPHPNRYPNPKPNLSDEQVLEYVRQFDRSGDGLLSLSEFSKLVTAS